MLDVYACGRIERASINLDLGRLEACVGASIRQLSSLAGGLGARCAPSGEREGQRRLASVNTFASRRRGAAPPRKCQHLRIAEAWGQRPPTAITSAASALNE